jgi:hypothetical protein
MGETIGIECGADNGDAVFEFDFFAVHVVDIAKLGGQPSFGGALMVAGIAVLSGRQVPSEAGIGE